MPPPAGVSQFTAGGSRNVILSPPARTVKSQEAAGSLEAICFGGESEDEVEVDDDDTPLAELLQPRHATSHACDTGAVREAHAPAPPTAAEMATATVTGCCSSAETRSAAPPTAAEMASATPEAASFAALATEAPLVVATPASKPPARVRRRSDAAAPAMPRSRVAGAVVARAGSEVAVVPLPLRFAESGNGGGEAVAPQAFADSSTYTNFFIRAVLADVQARLGDIANCLRRAAPRDPGRFHSDVSVVVRGAWMKASEGPGMVELIFGKRCQVLRGDIRQCNRNDLWVLFINGPEPLLFRAIWRGVTPTGRLLCSAVNEAAVAWAAAAAGRAEPGQGKAKLVAIDSALASGAFASELSQLEALRAAGDECATGPSAGRLWLLLGCAAAPAAAAAAAAAPAPAPAEAERELASLSAEQAAVAAYVAAWAEKPSPARGAVLVRGVFGSGKSQTLAASIILLDRRLAARRDPRRILLLCQTNAAVDGVLRHLMAAGWDDFARLGSFRGVAAPLLYRTVSLAASRPAAAKELSEALQRLPAEQQAPLQAAIDRGVLPPRAAAWRRRRLVVATSAALEAAEHLGPEALRCPLVLVDEATQLTEPVVFACLRRCGAEQLLLAGDPRQLPPRSRHAALGRTLLERLWNDAPTAQRAELLAQYRCHPALAEMCGSLFYGGLLRSGVTAAERGPALGASAPPLAAILSEGAEARVGQSYAHQAEAQLCAAWVARALRCGAGGGLLPGDVCVVCLYRPQAEACARALAAAGCAGVEAATVDAFQGGEREVVVLSCGRSTAAAAGDTFACCPRRLNVALSRARRHLVVVGGERFLAGHPQLGAVLAAADRAGQVHAARVVLGS